ncbi:hypothetical protein DFH07DRAFT_767478 [Mycena maculata]|uniref:Uncharacterized protein n=1 Tax=Mycena maculata TaxID=230809 RepID=A0AAD7JYD5_9AGAR|nr:hypothetical protein DFH07DRAFT_767478 [Mycena maculata]
MSISLSREDDARKVFGNSVLRLLGNSSKLASEKRVHRSSSRDVKCGQTVWVSVARQAIVVWKPLHAFDTPQFELREIVSECKTESRPEWSQCGTFIALYVRDITPERESGSTVLGAAQPFLMSAVAGAAINDGCVKVSTQLQPFHKDSHLGRDTPSCSPYIFAGSKQTVWVGFSSWKHENIRVGRVKRQGKVLNPHPTHRDGRGGRPVARPVLSRFWEEEKRPPNRQPLPSRQRAAALRVK